MDPNFEKGSSDNLPEINFFMIHQYYIDNLDYLSAEVRSAKSVRATKASYGDDAVGYVQLKRDGNICTVKGRIAPEHKVRNKAYTVIATIDETDNKIISCQCEDCAAALGGCKHAIAFLYWLLRRSDEPSPTSVESYWAKPVLAKVGTTLKFMKAMELKVGEAPKELDIREGFVEKVIEQAPEGSNSQILNYFNPVEGVKTIGLHNLCLTYMTSCPQTVNSVTFLKYCANKMEDSICNQAANETVKQSKSPLWYELRYGRITASNVHEAAHCKTLEGSLVEKIFGAVSIPDNDAVRRGRLLEDEVVEVVAKERNIKLKKVGLVLNNKYPALGASPDAVSDVYVIEVKCPAKSSTAKIYLNPDGTLPPKYLGQILLQMCFCKKIKGLFCVAAYNFETTKKVQIVEVDYDEMYLNELICNAMKFWEKAVFPALVN